MTAVSQRRKAAMGRREALLSAGKIFMAGCGTAVLAKCKGPTTPEPDPPPTPASVSVLVKFYNHTQGYIGERTYSGRSGAQLSIKVADCPDLSTVDPDRIAVREAFRNGWPGKLVEYSRAGQLSQTKFPSQDLVYDAFLMNKTNGADYSLIDNFPGGIGRLLHPPRSTWWRYDERSTGQDEIPREAVRQIQEATIFPWARYMNLVEVQSGGDFFIGYACPDDGPGLTWRGYAHDLGAWVNPIQCNSLGYPLLRIFLEQIFKHLTGCGGSTAEVAPSGMMTFQYMTDDQALNAIGRDLLAYVPVKDVNFAAV